jgi:deferrochelatase/peroxidase EfeB
VSQDTADSRQGTVESGPRLSRRAVLGGIGAFGVGAAAGALSSHAAWAESAPAATDADQIVAFHGPHQAGIVTPSQDRLVFGSLNVVAGARRDDVREMLWSWSAAALRMTRGQLVGEVDELTAAPIDTGEAVDSPVSRLTITIGYGPTFFDERFGLSAKRPALLATLPALPNEDLDPNSVGGDIAIQACSDNPLVAYHAVRNLARLGMGVVEHNWLELGFGRTSTDSTSQSTPRNLLGFKDGTRNLKAQQRDLLDRYVWVGGEADQPWLRGGSYLVARKIRMFLENWDRDYLGDQQNVIGRVKSSGAPLSGGTEFTTPDFGATDSTGDPMIPAKAHVRLASHEENDGLRILRRGYSYTDGIDRQRGTLLGGLLFLAYMKSPAQFIALQNRLGRHDALNEYISHVGSALFACPPGLAPGQSWGDTLFT